MQQLFSLIIGQKTYIEMIILKTDKTTTKS